MGRLKEAARGFLFCEAMGRNVSMAFFNSIRPVPAHTKRNLQEARLVEQGLERRTQSNCLRASEAGGDS
jgi:hypothetical protein